MQQPENKSDIMSDFSIFLSAIENVSALQNDGTRQLLGDCIQIEIRGTQYTHKGRPRRNRTIRVTLSGDLARSWVNNPNFGDIWDVYGADLGDGSIDDDELELLDVSVSAEVTF